MLTEQRIKDLEINLDRLGGLTGDALAGLDYQAIADRLNTRPWVPNPEPQQAVKTGNIGAVLIEMADEISDADLKLIKAANDRIAILQSAGAGIFEPSDRLSLMIKKGLSKGVADRLTAELKKEEPDPNWRSEIEGPVMIFPAVIAEEIQAYICTIEQAEHDAAQPAIEAELERLRAKLAEEGRQAIELAAKVDAEAMQAAMAVAFAEGDDVAVAQAPEGEVE